MCLQIKDQYRKTKDKEKPPRPTILKKKRSCWKIVKSNNLSLVECFKYVVGRSYSTTVTPVRHESVWSDVKRWDIDRGFHSYLTKKRALEVIDHGVGYLQNTIHIVRCTIPKGAKVWRDNRKDKMNANAGTQVSDKLIYGK